ncbi:hypothetical protein B296_00015170 [Ensete ventricosum]|uniref:Uncharacterized protein n=1 Tax=Ensete ventricosum TaxID=4639 RepID=A0A426Y858_ENSVE|nr:hypothetical protein B296_00015170 [Ensete ventricosum]
MGCLLSKRPSMRPTRRISGGGSGSSNGIGGGHQENGADGSRTSGDTNAGESGIQYTAELTSYEAACRLDPELRSFDAALQQRTSHAISTLALGVELRCLSFDTLREVTGCLLETNKQVVNAILECRKDVWKSPELLSLVDEYFECSIQTLDYCTELEKCLKKARDSHLIIQFAIQRFEEEDNEKNEVVTEQDGKTRYTVTLEKLRHFKAAGSPFTEEFARVLKSVYEHQKLMLEKLLLRKKKLDDKMKSIDTWRRVSNITFVAALVAVIVCSVVAAAIAAPPVAAALAAATAIPIGSMGKWINSLLKNCQNALGRETELLTSMQFGTFIALKDLDTIRVLVDKLEIHFNSLLENADFAIRDEEAVKFAIEEIKKNLEVFMKNIEDLGVEVDRCSRDTSKARMVVVRTIIKHPRE